MPFSMIKRRYLACQTKPIELGNLPRDVSTLETDFMLP